MSRHHSILVTLALVAASLALLPTPSSASTTGPNS
jgi:hypothetical protein